ncbi:MAG: hypothetical protein KDA28_01050, partial [Phycisphaerales bacterium]|nr:hypothetical protein [Phycisphaerales bacterium]
LASSGPVGLGMVEVLGVHPDRLSEVIDIEASLLAWATVLDPLLPVVGEGEQVWANRWSGALGDVERQALDNVFQLIGDIPSPGDGTFVVIASLCILLAIMVGPFDMIVLKRLKKRHLSWATALVWVGLASVLAWMAPGVSRQGASAINRFEIIDKVVPPGASAADAMGLPAWSTSVTGLFAAAPMRYTLETDASGRWWRSVEVTSWARSGGRRPLLGLGQGASSLTDPVGQVPLGFTAGQWTYESTMDRGPVDVPFDARLVGDRLLVTGFEGATIEGAFERAGDDTRVVRFEREGALHRGATTDDTRTFLDRRIPRGSGSLDTTYVLPGAVTRSLALERLVESGHFGILHLAVQDHDGMRAMTGDEPVRAEINRWRYVRIAIPLEDP